MPTTNEDLMHMFDDGVNCGATHMVIVRDTFDSDVYPVYVMSDQNVRNVVNKYNVMPMQKVIEVYNLSLDKYKQCYNNRVVFNY